MFDIFPATPCNAPIVNCASHDRDNLNIRKKIENKLVGIKEVPIVWADVTVWISIWILNSIYNNGDAGLFL